MTKNKSSGEFIICKQCYDIYEKAWGKCPKCGSTELATSDELDIEMNKREKEMNKFFEDEFVPFLKELGIPLDD